MAKEIVSVFIVTEYKTGKQWEEFMGEDVQEAMKALREYYPRFTKFVFEGFEIDGNFKPLFVNVNV